MELKSLEIKTSNPKKSVVENKILEAFLTKHLQEELEVVGKKSKEPEIKSFIELMNDEQLEYLKKSVLENYFKEKIRRKNLEIEQLKKFKESDKNNKTN